METDLVQRLVVDTPQRLFLHKGPGRSYTDLLQGCWRNGYDDFVKRANTFDPAAGLERDRSFLIFQHLVYSSIDMDVFETDQVRCTLGEARHAALGWWSSPWCRSPNSAS